MAAKKTGPKASNWNKLNTRSSSDTLKNRDVFNSQQLDRGRFDRLRSNKGGIVLAWILGSAVTILVWLVFSVGSFIVANVTSSMNGSTDTVASSYYREELRSNSAGGTEPCWRAVDETGNWSMSCHPTLEEIPVPQWYLNSQAADAAAVSAEPVADTGVAVENTLATQLATVTMMKLFLSLGGGLGVGVVIASVMGRMVARHNVRNSTADINQHHGDQHLALPEEIQRSAEWFPDAGAHASVEVSSMLSHMMLQNKGLGNFEVVKRADKDVVEDGEVIIHKGAVMYDDNDEPVVQSLPKIDEAFGNALFDASGLPEDKTLRKFYDTRKIPYNPGGKDRSKLKYDTVGQMIRDDWEFPPYEVQRPGGAYMVDSAPVNTMVLAITRGGKGQGYIEPVIDMWSREKNPSNMVMNDPKGELLVNNYVPLVMRGFQPIQFNLINTIKTDIYNPLGMASEAAREGDAPKCALYVENIADVFFPLDGGEDPVWPNAANNAFKRAAYGLIDYYLEEERELREYAASVSMDPELLERRLDDMWGKVTMYNTYQMFVQLTSKKLKNPLEELERRKKAGDFDEDDEAYEMAKDEAEAKAVFWEDKPDADLLTLFFNATAEMPVNGMRTLVGNAHNALKSMAGAEKMLASVYGIAITAMSFFTDPTIATLTSGKPSQNTDLGSLSFPRRFGVRLSQNYVRRYDMVGQKAVWSAYSDPLFENNLGKDFDHEDMVTREGWVRYYFKGKVKAEQAWVKLELLNPQSGMLVRTFYFRFKKGYQLSLNRRHFIKEEVTGQKIIKNGVLQELRPVIQDGKTVAYSPAVTTYPQDQLVPEGDGWGKRRGQARAITQTMARYSESPKAVFLITPPHLSKYAKLILILLKQLVDLNFDKSYMTKNNQKPLYRTRFMLDELGNLQSEGNGISGFETMLSIGLGQEQQFTLILQTLQQLRDVYGESVDKIVQGNTANIVFLKSTDETMLESLEKIGGTTHRSYTDSKQLSEDYDKPVGGKTEGRVSYTTSTVKEPLISVNDMLFLPSRNSIIFRAGESPIWNRNETVLPMSWRLLRFNPIVNPGQEYSLKTVPTQSTAKDFDVRQNQPDFAKMVEKRMSQAVRSAEAVDLYSEAYGYKEIDIARLDPDIVSDEIMSIITLQLAMAAGVDPNGVATVDPDELEAMSMFSEEEVFENVEMAAMIQNNAAANVEFTHLRYAEGTISRDMLVSRNGVAKVKSLDEALVEAYRSVMQEMHQDRTHFSVGGEGDLRSADGTQVYISENLSKTHAESLRRLNGQAHDPKSRVFAEDDLDADDPALLSTMTVHAAFYSYLASLSTWEVLANGHFDRAVAIEMNR